MLQLNGIKKISTVWHLHIAQVVMPNNNNFQDRLQKFNIVIIITVSALSKRLLSKNHYTFVLGLSHPYHYYRKAFYSLILLRNPHKIYTSSVRSFRLK